MQALGREGRLDVAVAIQQWQTHAQATHHDRSVTARLCDGILGLFQEVIRQVALQQPTSKIPKRVRRSLERAHGIVALWSDGYGVKDGHLDDVLAKSRKIRQATLKILSSITDALVKRLIPLARLSSEKLDAFVLQVEATTDEASYVIHDADASDSDVSSDALSDLELEDSIAEVAEDLKTDAQCLMDLDPLFRNPVLDVSTQKEDKALQILEWAPEKAYVDKIQQRFPQADGSLVEMLGRANWSRYLRCQEQRNGTGEEEEEEDEAEVIYNRAPAAVRASVELHGTIVSSKYHDSGLGTSLPTASVYAETVMTYSGPGEGQKIRIPPLPDEARRGKPFACVACGKTVHISNNRKWKQHLYVDLRPDLCLEDGCLGFSFAHRADWISHLALDHQYEPDWVAITCPLCLERTEPGRLAVTSHLARHLEEISLSALPPSPDDDEVSVSSRASSESTHEGIVADAYGRRHKCVCGGASPFLEEYSTSVACGTCNTWQHVGCYYKYSDWTAVEKPGFSHHCEECEPRQLEVEFTRRAASLSSQGNKVRCVCGLQEPPHSPREIVMEDYSEQNMVCSRCFVWQHGYCIALTDEVETRMRGKPYFCDACAPFLHTTYDIESGGKQSVYLPFELVKGGPGPIWTESPEPPNFPYPDLEAGANPPSAADTKSLPSHGKTESENPQVCLGCDASFAGEDELARHANQCTRAGKMPAVGDTTANPTESQKTQYYYNEEVLRRLAEAREANQHLMGENKRLQDELQRASSLGTSKEAKDTIQRLIRAQEANMQKMQRLRKLYKRTSRQQQQQQHEADPDQLAAEDYDETAYRDHVAEEDAILDDDEPANLFADEEEIMRQEEEDNRRQDEEDAIRDAEDAMREQEYDMDDELLGLDRRSIGSDWTEHGDPRASVQKTKSGGIMSPPRVSGPSTFAEETETRPPNQKRRYLQGDEKRPRKPKWSQLQELYKKDGRDDDMRRVSELVRKQDALAQELEVLMQEDEMKRKQQQQQVEQAQIAELESHEAAADRAREATERWAREEEEEEKARKEEEFRQDAEEELRQEREREQQLRRLEEEEATIYDDDTDDSVGFDGEDEEEDEYLREARGEE